MNEGATGPPPEPAATVREFLELLEAGRVDAACDLLAEDVDYVNVSLPVLRGRQRIRSALEAVFARRSVGLEVHIHSIAAEGGTVLTERTDVIVVGPVRAQIWVCGRFDVVDGRIELWKDYFDWWNIAVAVARGVLGAIVASLRSSPRKVRPGGS